jgi:hypothetical protein
VASERKELREALKLAIKGLIIQEFRVLQLEQSYTPPFVRDEMAHSIQEAKREIIGLVRRIPSEERNALIKRFIRQSVDKEIDRAIQLRENRCLRCLHMRFYDEARNAHVRLPVGTRRARIVGCDQVRPASRVRCRRFVEITRATSLGGYLDEMALLYELREMFDQLEEMWDYLTI